MCFEFHSLKKEGLMHNLSDSKNHPITLHVALEIASHEALVRQTYYDSLKIPTWSVGMTSATGHRVENYWGSPQSYQKCMDVYVWALDKYAQSVRERFADVDLSESQFSGILSWTWNVGSGWLQKATWIDFFKKGDMREAERRFMLFDKPKEIINRRKKEANLIFRGVWNNQGTMTEYTYVNKSGTPDWQSAIVIDIERNIQDAIIKLNKSQDFSDSPQINQELTLTPDAIPKPKPIHQSTTIWATVLQYLGGTITAFASLDYKVAVPLIIIGGALCFWVIRERYKKRKMFGI